MIVVVDICYWLHPVVNPRMRRGVTELKSEKINWRVKVFLFCVQIYEFQYYTVPVGYLTLSLRWYFSTPSFSAGGGVVSTPLLNFAN